MCNANDPRILNGGDIIEKDETDEKQDRSASSSNACCFHCRLFLLVMLMQLLVVGLWVGGSMFEARSSFLRSSSFWLDF